jgi:hypothetical protein
VQDQLLLLRKSLQLKLSHLARCSEFEHIKSALLKVEQAIMAAILQLIGREEHNVDVELIRLPLRLGGVGIQCLTEDEGLVCRAGFIAAAALTQQALATAPESLQPFKGKSGDLFLQLAATGEYGMHMRTNAKAQSGGGLRSRLSAQPATLHVPKAR